MTHRSDNKSRADVLVAGRGLAPSRSRAQELIRQGRILANGQPVVRAGELLDAAADLVVTPGTDFVSRGGEKLEGALAAFGIDVTSAVVADLGASTGGFTDCLLRRGARKVYAVDVGEGQLAPSLRDDPRVVVRDRTNARALTATDFDEALDLVVVDASFIGIEKLVPALARILPPGGRLVALVKPQFEVGPEAARRAKGVVRDPALRGRAVAEALDAVRAGGFDVLCGADSVLPGPRGNVEHFVHAVRRALR